MFAEENTYVLLKGIPSLHKRFVRCYVARIVIFFQCLHEGRLQGLQVARKNEVGSNGRSNQQKYIKGKVLGNIKKIVCAFKENGGIFLTVARRHRLS